MERLLPLALPQAHGLEHPPLLHPISRRDNDHLRTLLEEALPFVISDSIAADKTRRLKVLLVTWEAVDGAMAALAASLHSGRALHVAAAQVLQLHPSPSSSPPDPLDAPTGLLVHGRLLPALPAVLSAAFKEWLTEEAGPEAHVSLTLHGDDPMLLDYAETVISPQLLPASLRGRLGWGGGAAPRTATGTAPYSSLSCVSRLRLCSVSPAWCCGPLLHLLPSAAALLTFQQYDHNVQRVLALHRCLEAGDEALLCCPGPALLSSATTSSSRAEQATLSPKLLVYAAHDGVLALTSLVPSELWLPHTVCPNPALQPQVLSLTRGALACVPVAHPDDLDRLLSTGMVAVLRRPATTAATGSCSRRPGDRGAAACRRVLPLQQQQFSQSNAAVSSVATNSSKRQRPVDGRAAVVKPVDVFLKQQHPALTPSIDGRPAPRQQGMGKRTLASYGYTFKPL